MKWEYKICGYGLMHLQDKLNDEGTEGWELVSLQQTPEDLLHVLDRARIMAVFKRQLSSAPLASKLA